METFALHPKVDCPSNRAEERAERLEKRNESSEAPVAQRIDCQLPSLYRLQGPLNGSGRCLFGGIAQLGERLPCKQEVSGSNPLISIHGSLAQSVRALA